MNSKKSMVLVGAILLVPLLFNGLSSGQVQKLNYVIPSYNIDGVVFWMIS